MTDATNQAPLPPILATVMSKSVGIVVSINAQPVSPAFYMEGDRLFASTGQEVVFPGEDDAMRNLVRQQVAARWRSDPDSVFVVEFGPTGPVAEHSIAPR